MTVAARLFAEIERLTEERWRRRDYREEALPDVALEVFGQLTPHRHLGLEELVAHVTRADRFPAQSYGRIDERLLIPMHGRRFYLEVIFWVDEMAAPHHHSFTGAFHVLSGLRLHTTYRFEETRRVNARFRLGNLCLDRAEVLETGASRPIHAGAGFVHALSHIDRPSLSLVIAANDAAGEPQLNYRAPHVAAAARHGDPVLAAQLRMLDLVHDVDAGAYPAVLGRAVAAADVHSAFELLAHGYERLRERGRFDDLLGGARRVHGDVVDLFSRVFDEENRRRWFRVRRDLVTEREQRFFLAVLLHVPERAAIDALLAARYPGTRPAARAAAFFAELAALRAPDGRNVLDLPFDEGALAVLGLLLEGVPPERVAGRLVEEHGFAREDVPLDDLRDLVAALVASPLFRPLFT